MKIESKFSKNLIFLSPKSLTKNHKPQFNEDFSNTTNIIKNQTFTFVLFSDMFKKSLILPLMILLFSVSFAYSPMSKIQHQQIDLQLSGFSNLSKSEKSKEADFFLRLAQKSLEIRQAFNGGKGKIPGAKLTPTDKLYIKKKIEVLSNYSKSDLEKEMKDLKETQLMSYEL